MAAVAVSISGRRAVRGITKYVVCVFDGKRPISVARTYNEFLNLHQSLASELRNVPEFPQRSASRAAFSSLSVQLSLMSMLQEFVSADPSLQIGQLRDFLGMPANADDPTARQTCGHVEQHDLQDRLAATAAPFVWAGKTDTLGDSVVIRCDSDTGKPIFDGQIHEVASTATGSFQSDFSNVSE